MSASPTLAAFAAAWRPQDRRPVCEWGEQYVRPPGSARATRLDVSATPWLREPIEFSADNAVKEQVLLMPTGAGKTTLFDVKIPHSISEDPGSILALIQTDPDAKDYAVSRLEPILTGIPHIAAVAASLPRNRRKVGEWIMPHMSLYVRGLNHSNVQRISVRTVLIDEAWTAKHGLIAEARARTHDRWNQRVIIVSQGGDTHIDIAAERIETELYAAWKRTDQREWSIVCPECGDVYPWKWAGLKYEDATDAHNEIDETAISESAHMICMGRCATRFEDKPIIRRQLATDSRYVVTKPNHMRGHIGWHVHALSLYYVPWGTLAIEWKKANIAWERGDRTPRKIFIQKRGAEFWKDPEEDVKITLSGAGYTFRDYEDGQPVDGEAYRFCTIDRQRDHRWVVIRAWRADGSSRLLFAGRINTSEEIKVLCDRMKVKPALTFQDAQWETGAVYDECVKYGWTALHGDKASSYPHIDARAKRVTQKFYSPIKRASAPGGGQCLYFFWSNEKIKDILTNLRNGHGASYEIADDTSPDWHEQMNSEIKKDQTAKITKAVSSRYVRIGGRPNHLWDGEAMQVTAAVAFGVLSAPEAATSEESTTEEHTTQ